MRFQGDTTTGGFNVAPIQQLRNSGVFGATVYGDAGKPSRLFTDLTFETSGSVKRLTASVGLGRSW